jgi:hypothetical protein
LVFIVGSPSLTQPSSFTWAQLFLKGIGRVILTKQEGKKKDMEINPTKKEIQILDL